MSPGGRGRPPSMRRAAGLAAESLAAGWLEDRGYTVVDRNFTVRGGELDLVVTSETVLAFVEVRSRATVDRGRPEETVTPRKMRRVVLAARHWLARHGDLGRDVRFDVVAVTGDGDAREIVHFPGAFEAGQ